MLRHGAGHSGLGAYMEIYNLTVNPQRKSYYWSWELKCFGS